MRLIDPFIAALLAAGLLIVGAAPSRAATFTINQWPQDIGKVPCEAWANNPDGSWMLVARIQAGTTTISGKNFRAGSGEAQMLSAKCHR